jgi:hypothetical protein
MRPARWKQDGKSQLGDRNKRDRRSVPENRKQFLLKLLIANELLVFDLGVFPANS